VLKVGGLLVAPNFVSHKGVFMSRMWSGILKLAGIKFEHQWNTGEYCAFLERNGWKVIACQEMEARITLAYVECVRHI